MEYNDIIFVINFKMIVNRIIGLNLDEEAVTHNNNNLYNKKKLLIHVFFVKKTNTFIACLRNDKFLIQFSLTLQTKLPACCNCKTLNVQHKFRFR